MKSPGHAYHIHLLDLYSYVLGRAIMEVLDIDHPNNTVVPRINGQVSIWPQVQTALLVDFVSIRNLQPRLWLFSSRLRSYIGWPPVRDSKPNTTHTALAALQYSSFIPRLITQNVDGLHSKAIGKMPGWGIRQQREQILELHGTLHVSG